MTAQETVEKDTEGAPPSWGGRLRDHWDLTLGGLPRTFWVVWGGTLANRLGTMVRPFLALYLIAARGLTPAQAGAVLAVFGAGAVASQLAGGTLVDRVGARTAFLGSLVAAAATLLGLGFVRGLPGILAVAFLAGFTLDMYRPASSTLVAETVAPKDLTRAYALLHWSINIGFSVAAVLGGELARLGYVWLFVVDAATCLAFAVVIYLLLAPESGARAPRRAGVSYLTVLRDGLFAVVLVTMLVRAVVQFQSTAALPLAMRDDGLSTADFGVAIGANGIGVVVLSPLLLRLFTRRDGNALLALGTVVLGAGFGLNALADSLPAYVVAVVVWTVGEIAIASSALSLVARLAPPGLQGRYQGVLGLAYGLATVIAPLVGIGTLHGFGATVLWVGCVAVCLLSALVQLACRGPVRARMAAPAARDGG